MIIGAQKSASTFIQRCLASHPGIAMPRIESPEFEDPVYGQGGMAQLASIFATAPAGARRGIKRPDYLGLPEVPARIAWHAPDARLVVVLRDPVARAVSAYRMYVASNQAALMHVDEAFTRLLDHSMEEKFPRAHEILDWGRYGEHLQRYRRYFGADRTLVVLQDEVAADPRRVFTLTCEFLDVDAGFVPTRMAARSNVGPRSRLHLRLRRTRTLARMRYLARRLEVGPSIVGRLTWPYVAALTVVDRHLMAHLPGALDQLGPRTVAALRDYYRDDVRSTQDLIHRDLRAWM